MSGPITAEAAEEYTHSLGQIGPGFWRQIAWADNQGIPAVLGLTVERWVKERLGGYIRLGIAERRVAVAELLHDGMSQRKIAISRRPRGYNRQGPCKCKRRRSSTTGRRERETCKCKRAR
jgi:hypothetical protein